MCPYEGREKGMSSSCFSSTFAWVPVMELRQQEPLLALPPMPPFRKRLFQSGEYRDLCVRESRLRLDMLQRQSVVSLEPASQWFSSGRCTNDASQVFERQSAGEPAFVRRSAATTQKEPKLMNQCANPACAGDPRGSFCAVTPVSNKTGKEDAQQLSSPCKEDWPVRVAQLVTSMFYLHK